MIGNCMQLQASVMFIRGFVSQVCQSLQARMHMRTLIRNIAVQSLYKNTCVSLKKRCMRIHVQLLQEPVDASKCEHLNLDITCTPGPLGVLAQSLALTT